MNNNIIINNLFSKSNIKQKYIDLLLSDNFVIEKYSLILSNKNDKEYFSIGDSTINKFFIYLTVNKISYDKELIKNKIQYNFENLSIDIIYDFIGYTEYILDKKMRVGVGYSIIFDVLYNIFKYTEIKEKEKTVIEDKVFIQNMIEKNKLYKDKFVITLTFGEVAENHKGMQLLGYIAKEGEGLNIDDFVQAKINFENNGFKCEIIDLVKEGDVGHFNPPPRPAYVLIVKNGINALLEDDKIDIQNINNEVLKDDWDNKLYDIRTKKVQNKHARHNLNYADFAQEPDYAVGKGRVIPFDSVPLVNKIRETIPIFFNKDKTTNLFAEGNFYYDLKKCGIGFHGDGERRIVIAVRLGTDSIPFHYQWFRDQKPVGKRIIFNLNPGDVYAMSEVAVGTDWKKHKNHLLTLRHATGADKYTTIKK
jgi:hypothetical protein